MTPTDASSYQPVRSEIHGLYEVLVGGAKFIWHVNLPVATVGMIFGGEAMAEAMRNHELATLDLKRVAIGAQQMATRVTAVAALALGVYAMAVNS